VFICDEKNDWQGLHESPRTDAPSALNSLELDLLIFRERIWIREFEVDAQLAAAHVLPNFSITLRKSGFNLFAASVEYFHLAAPTAATRLELV